MTIRRTAGRAILSATPKFPGIFAFLVDSKPQKSAAKDSHQQIKRVEALKRVRKRRADCQESPKTPIQHVTTGGHAVRLPQLGSH